MGMNIKSDDTHRRAKELARMTGESIAEAVDRAVTERLERLRRQRNRKALAAKLLRLGEQCSRLAVIDERSAEEMLYDDNGLPTMIVVDTSALIAILDREPDAALYAEAIAEADSPLIRRHSARNSHRDAQPARRQSRAARRPLD